jgi:hypothetical protein
MALPKISAKSYNYGAYANPKAVKLADRSGLAKGIVQAAETIAEGLVQKKKKDKLEEEQQKLKDEKRGVVIGAREAAIGNLADTADIFQSMSEAGVNIDLDLENGVIDSKEAGRLKVIEGANYKDAVAATDMLENIQHTPIDTSQIKTSDLENYKLREAVSKGNYKYTKYDATGKGAEIAINYEDASGNAVSKTFLASDIIANDNLFNVNLKFNYTQDASKQLDAIRKKYDDNFADEHVKVDAEGKFYKLDKEAAVNAIKEDPATLDIIKRIGKDIWEDSLGNEEGTYDPSDPAMLDAVVSDFAAHAVDYGKVNYGRVKVEKERPTKMTEGDINRFNRSVFNEIALNYEGGLTAFANQEIPGIKVDANEDGTVTVKFEGSDEDPITYKSESSFLQFITDNIDVNQYVELYKRNVKAQQEAQKKADESKYTPEQQAAIDKYL